MPAADVIALWFASTVSHEESALEDLGPLAEDERVRARRFHFAKDRHVFVLGKRLVRSVLGEALQESAAALVFEAGPHGKPRLAGAAARSGLDFNLAHSGT